MEYDHGYFPTRVISYTFSTQKKATMIAYIECRTTYIISPASDILADSSVDIKWKLTSIQIFYIN